MAKKTMTKRFYVGANVMVNHPFWLVTLPEAIEGAKRRLDKDKHMEEIYVVEVIRIVRRDKPPYIVEETR